MSNLFPDSPQPKDNFIKKLQQNPKNTAVYFGVAFVLFFLLAASLAPRLNKGFGLLTQKKVGQQSFANLENGTTTLQPQQDGFISIFDSKSDGNDRGQDLTTDLEGNIYVTGSYTTGKDSGSAIFVRKYSPAGEVIWTQSHTGADSNPQEALGTAIKANNQSVFVAGYITSAVSKKDIYFAKYSTDGELIWKKEFNLPSNDDDIANDFAFDSRNNIYLVGTQTQPKSGSDIFVAKLDSTGNLIWTRNFTTNAKEAQKLWPGNDIGTAITVSATGEIYVTGNMDFSAEGQRQKIWLANLDTNGKPLWDKTLDEGEAASLAIDSQNRLLLAGKVYVKEQNGDKFANALIIKFDAGKEIARDIFDAGSNNEEATSDTTTDASGNIYAVGSQIREGQKQVFIRIYNRELKFQKDKIIEFAAQTISPSAIVRAQNGTIFLTGSTTSGTNSDIFLTSVSPF